MYKVTKTDFYTDVNVINIIAREDLIEPGDEELEEEQENPIIDPKVISGADRISRTRNYTYVSPHEDTVDWLLEDDLGIVKIVEKNGDKVIIRAEKTQFITFKLIAIYLENGQQKRSEPKDIRIVSLM